MGQRRNAGGGADKADLCEEAPARAEAARSAAIGVDVVPVCGLTGEGAQSLLPYIRGKTVVFIGSSGVGKSTLLNCLAGHALMKTGGTRADGRGRHTTTRRELFPLCGGAVIDTPGMRELGLESGDFERSFADIETLAQYCRFGDCAHKTEPGCAVLEAVRRGEVSEARLSSYHKLRKEAGYDGLSSREIEAKKRRSMFTAPSGVYVEKRKGR
jgi:ribosome biogenesis GTPase